MNQMSDATKPLLRIRANASENVKGIVSCEATVEFVEDLKPGVVNTVTETEGFVAAAIEETLSKLHEVLRSNGHKLAVDGGA